MPDAATPRPDDAEPGRPGSASSRGGGGDGPPTVGKAFIAAVVVVLVLVVGVGAFLLARGGSDPVEHRYYVPAGTGARLDQGEDIEIIPNELDVHVDDVLIVQNDDSRTHLVGPFPVRAGETLTYTFTAPGEIKGACSLHPSGEVTINVS